MENKLSFDENKYEIKSCEMGGRRIRCRAFEGIDYCRMPADPIQKMNIFVPEDYYEGRTINGYDIHTAPIFMPNTVGGYMPGAADAPGYDHKGRINAVFQALEHGYVVACAGIRGRSSGRGGKEFFEGGTLNASSVDTGRNTGKAPALIVDMKAAVRYLRFNKEVIPGNTDRIITSGTSAGGALSALAGASGNSSDFEPYLREIGAAEALDDIFAANCYCPIHNLEHADMAYEWQFNGCRDYYHTRHVITDGGLSSSVEKGVMNDAQVETSKELCGLFPDYLNSLGLKDPSGDELVLDGTGKGSFFDYLVTLLKEAVGHELKAEKSGARLAAMGERACPVSEAAFLKIENGSVVSFDWDLYIKTITRMKAAPAFDALDLKSPENHEFGDSDLPLTGTCGADGAKCDRKHFTEYSYGHSTADGTLADAHLVRMLNPLNYIGGAGTAEHWRIRHGMFDRDTSLAIPVILATYLENKGFDVDFELPWGLPHSGDYDLDELFEWIDGIV